MYVGQSIFIRTIDVHSCVQCSVQTYTCTSVDCFHSLSYVCQQRYDVFVCVFCSPVWTETSHS